MSSFMAVQSSLMKCACFRDGASFSEVNLCDGSLHSGLNMKHFVVVVLNIIVTVLIN